MKIVVVINKYGTQYNIDVTQIFFDENEVIQFGEPTEEFVRYFEELTNETCDSFYFKHVLWVNTNDLIKEQCPICNSSLYMHNNVLDNDFVMGMN